MPLEKTHKRLTVNTLFIIFEAYYFPSTRVLLLSGNQFKFFGRAEHSIEILRETSAPKFCHQQTKDPYSVVSRECPQQKSIHIFFTYPSTKHIIMYSDCSSKYWKQRQKPNTLKLKIISCSMFVCAILLLIGHHGHRQRKQKETERFLEEQRRNTRPNATEVQFVLCESNMRDRADVECMQLCKDEIISIPRPTMYQSCVHGCSRSFFASAVHGCRSESIEKDMERDDQMNKASPSCSRYQRVEPQPHVFTTCRKYFREGVMKGKKLGNELINNLIDAEWVRIRNEV